MRLLLLLYPRWRHRYGDELLELLASSHRPLRDSCDVIATGVFVRFHAIKEEAMLLKTAPFVLLVVGCAGLAWSSMQLSDGLVEVPGHWWGTMATGPAAIGLVWLVARGARRRRG